jgi:rare lipoprotein A
MFVKMSRCFKILFVNLPPFLLLSALFLSACAETQLAIFAAKEIRKDIERDDDHDKAAQAPRYKVGKPYQVAGLWYYPHVDPTYNQTGIASWYGDPFHGQLTANGDTYDMNAMTAAHKTLPMPTEVEVTNLENGKSVQLTINDRGPFVHGRIIDVSQRAAILLGFKKKGTAKVRVKVLKAGEDERVIAYRETPENQKRALPAVRREKISAVPIEGNSTAAVSPAAPASGQIAKVTTEPQKSNKTGFIQTDDGIEGIGGKPIQVQVNPVTPTAIFVQVGTFSDFNNANRLRVKLSQYGPVDVRNVLIGNIEMFRVRMGPYPELQDADKMLAVVIDNGLEDARIVVNETTN